MARRFRILGCGSSGGVPRIHGDWGICDPNNAKNRRTRCSLMVSQSGDKGATNVLVDTSPDMREQLISADIRHLDAVLYTHDHADQTHGIDDLRAMVYANRKRIDVHMDDATAQTLLSRFGYCFETPKNSDYPPILNHIAIEKPDAPIALTGAGGDLTAQPFRPNNYSIYLS